MALTLWFPGPTNLIQGGTERVPNGESRQMNLPTQTPETTVNILTSELPQPTALEPTRPSLVAVGVVREAEGLS